MKANRRDGNEQILRNYYSGESTTYHRLHILHDIEILKQDATRNILQHGLQFIDLKHFLHVGYNVC